VIDCAGLVQGGRFVKRSTGARYRRLNAYTFPDVIELAWPDMTAPSYVGYRFWQELVGALPARTCVACMGGHGRTGTCLACLLVADGMDPVVAIETVRKNHCDRAIETPAQEGYIKAMAKQRDQAKGGGA
jgi:protein-tyrosine phosphatase